MMEPRNNSNPLVCFLCLEKCPDKELQVVELSARSDRSKAHSFTRFHICNVCVDTIFAEGLLAESAVRDLFFFFGAKYGQGAPRPSVEIEVALDNAKSLLVSLRKKSSRAAGLAALPGIIKEVEQHLYQIGYLILGPTKCPPMVPTSDSEEATSKEATSEESWLTRQTTPLRCSDIDRGPVALDPDKLEIEIEQEAEDLASDIEGAVERDLEDEEVEKWNRENLPPEAQPPDGRSSNCAHCGAPLDMSINDQGDSDLVMVELKFPTGISKEIAVCHDCANDILSLSPGSL